MDGRGSTKVEVEKGRKGESGGCGGGFGVDGQFNFQWVDVSCLRGGGGKEHPVFRVRPSVIGAARPSNDELQCPRPLRLNQMGHNLPRKLDADSTDEG
jgi:hypothetical protein